MTTEMIPARALYTLPVIHTARGDSSRGISARAWIQTFDTDHAHTGPSVTGIDEVTAWEAMCAKVTGLKPNPIQLWSDTRADLFACHRNSQAALSRLVIARKTFGTVGLEALVNDNHANQNDLVDVAVSDAVQYAALCSIQAAEQANNIRMLDAKICASDEADCYTSGPVRAVMIAIMDLIAVEVTRTLVSLGQAHPTDNRGSFEIHLSEADISQPSNFAEHVEERWSKSREDQLRHASTMLERIGTLDPERMAIRSLPAVGAFELEQAGSAPKPPAPHVAPTV